MKRKPAAAPASAPSALPPPLADRGALLVAAFVLVTRILYALLTRYLLDDALITARYGRNLAHGLGFVFNAGEPTYGFTSPAWVAISALGTLLGVPPHPWLAGIAIVCDVLTAFLAARLVPSRNGRIALAALLAAWPAYLSSGLGGMETSLLGLCAIAWWSRAWPDAAAAVAPLVRPEGWLLVIAHFVRSRDLRRAWVVLPGIAWIGFAWATFGSPLPLSVEAKRLVYGGTRLQRAVEWIYHLGQLPVAGVRPIKTAMVVASVSLWVTALACSRGGRGWGLALAGGWIAFLVASGAPLFEWYLAVPALLLIVAACRARILEAWPIGSAFLAANAVFLFVFAVEDGRLQRRLFEATWMDASRAVADIPQVSSVFAEAVGALGWYETGRVLDEVGLVTPSLFDYARGEDGWYGRAVFGMKPDALLVRPGSLYVNEPVAGTAKPFVDEAQFHKLAEYYVEVAEFADTNRYARRSVAVVRLLVRRDVAMRAGLASPGIEAVPASAVDTPEDE